MNYADILSELRILRDERKPLEARLKKITERENYLFRQVPKFPEARQGVLAAASGYTGTSVSNKTGGLRNARQLAAEARKAGVIGSMEATADPAPARKAAPKKLSATARKAAEMWGPPPADDAPVSTPTETPVISQAEDAPRIEDDAVVDVSGIVSRRTWQKQSARRTAIATAAGELYYGGETRMLDVSDGSVGAWLAALPEDVQRVYFIGARPWDTYATATKKGDALAWFSETPDGWKIGERGHYTNEPDRPTGRWQHIATGRTVEIKHLDEWTGGAVTATPEAAYQGLGYFIRGVQETFDPRKTGGLVLMGSPAQQGKDLWLRSIGNHAEYPVMSDELRELITTTSGQGRRELFTPPTVPTELPALFHYDMTFAYAAMVWGLPVGAPSRISAAMWERMDPAAQDKAVRGRGWWDVTVTVPEGWDHVGILGVTDRWTPGEKHWHYPSEPGRTFRTWCAGDELVIARRMGWHVVVNDAVVWAEGKPLTKWRDGMVSLWGRFGALAESTPRENYRQAAAVARAMARTSVLWGIGAMHGGSPRNKGIIDPSRADSLPAAARVEPTDDGRALMWESGRIKGHASVTSHPEWSALIYGRTRARLLLNNKAGTGVLHGVAEGRPTVARHEVVAFRADAVYVTRDLGWDNPAGEPGLLRLKGAHRSPVPAPLKDGELMELKDGAQ